ncbi:MAG: hypothetical protein AB1696_25535, partial [Planctomycetota bacterium]
MSQPPNVNQPQQPQAARPAQPVQAARPAQPVQAARPPQAGGTVSPPPAAGRPPEGGGAHRQVFAPTDIAELMNQAPWWVVSLVIHGILLIVLAAINFSTGGAKR